MNTANEDFLRVVTAVGRKPNSNASQNESRHYSEVFSKEVALWLRDRIIAEQIGDRVLPPEGKVDTIYGVGNRGKSLDVGVIDSRKYLLLNISIKTFNFKDKKTKNYRHNYTGRFYELLGEDLDLRRSYGLATLVAMIFLPLDSIVDTEPSSFAHAVRQFSKILKKDREEHELGFEYVFIGVHSEEGHIFFYDTSNPPPKTGLPRKSDQLTIDQVLSEITKTVSGRKKGISNEALPKYIPFEFTDPIDES